MLKTKWILDEHGDFVNKDKETDRLFENYNTYELVCSDFEILGDEIDIDSIEELAIGEITTEERLRINTVIKAVKQLNEKIGDK